LTITETRLDRQSTNEPTLATSSRHRRVRLVSPSFLVQFAIPFLPLFADTHLFYFVPASPGISSDQYFGRGSYDPAASSEAQSRLQQFSGASAISSNQYFGRDEEEQQQQAYEDGIGGGEGLEGLEKAARDVVGRVLSNPDVQNVGESIRAGAMKVSTPFRALLSRHRAEARERWRQE
jgi:hypothetical protein